MIIKVKESLRGQIARRIAISNAFRHTTKHQNCSSSFVCQRWLSSTSKPKYDPLAKRPNQKCDPYGQGEDPNAPFSLTRHFIHPDYLSGARFLHKIAAVAQINNHFPLVLSLERKIVKKNWQVVSSVSCHTLVLGGLSRHDFHLAMMMDVEVDRPDVQPLLLTEVEESAS